MKEQVKRRCCTCGKNERKKDCEGNTSCVCAKDGHHIGYVESFESSCRAYTLDDVYKPGGKWYREWGENISIIVARSRNNIIGKNGSIPWYIKEDLQYFKQVTTGGVVIMGKNTYESIGRPLSNRINIVVSSSMTKKRGIVIKKSLKSAIRYAAKHHEDKNIFLIGGYGIYKEGIDYAGKLYITEISADIDGDTSFVDFDETKYTKKVVKASSDGDLRYEFVEYTRKE